METETLASHITSEINDDNGRQLTDLLRKENNARLERERLRDAYAKARQQEIEQIGRLVGTLRPPTWLHAEGWAKSPEMDAAWPFITASISYQVKASKQSCREDDSGIRIHLVPQGDHVMNTPGMPLRLDTLPAKTYGAERAIIQCVQLADIQARLREEGFESWPSGSFNQLLHSYGWVGVTDCKLLLADWMRNGVRRRGCHAPDLNLSVGWNPEHY